MTHQQLLQHQQQIQQQILLLETNLASYPEGKLLCSIQDSRSKWYISDGHAKSYLPKSNRELAEQLAQKSLAEYTLQKLRLEEKAITAYLKEYSEGYKHLPQSPLIRPGYKELLASSFKPVSQELSEWMSAPYERNPHHPENLIHKTDMGFYVRSKAEAMIVHFLYIHKIPFQYERALPLDKTTYYPDFTIRHPVTGETFFWEHFGKMDDPAYCQKVGSKIQAYSIHGIIPSINLITTYETAKHPLSIETIQQNIKQFLL